MSNISNYVFWYDSELESWYAIPKDSIESFFENRDEQEITIRSKKIETLVYLIEHPTGLI